MENHVAVAKPPDDKARVSRHAVRADVHTREPKVEVEVVHAWRS